MSTSIAPIHNVTAVVPLLMITSMERSLAFYVDGLGFTIRIAGFRMVVCVGVGCPWAAPLMLQEATEAAREKTPTSGTLGNGASLYFQCTDALAIYREAATRGIHPSHEPQVGNSAWEVFFADPDGYKINFSSPTHLPEETLLSEVTS